MSPAERRELVDRQLRSLSIARQCQLMGVSRSSLYYRPKETSRQDLSLMRELDRQYLETPFYGSRRMKASLDRQGLPVSRKRVQRLMRLMGLRAIYRQPRTSQPAAGRRVYPYLLRDLTITRANQVWAADITYLPMARGFLYLVAIMDWHSRYVVAWGLSNTLEAGFCAEALTEALGQGRPDVFNTDQGSQFTSREFTQILQDHSVKISMDGRGRYQDNILVERLWRTVKYEEVYLKAYANGLEARRDLREYFRFYNHRRPHQALGYRTPAEVLPRRACRRGAEGKEVPGPTGLGIIRRSAGVPLNCGLILSNRWGPPHSVGGPSSNVCNGHVLTQQVSAADLGPIDLVAGAGMLAGEIHVHDTPVGRGDVLLINRAQTGLFYREAVVVFVSFVDFVLVQETVRAASCNVFCGA